jgi:hypothetical protein
MSTSQLDRYRDHIGLNGLTFYRDDGGKWCLAEDVTALEAERDTLREALVEANQDIEDLVAEWDAFVTRCREIRNGSPNAFYAHVDVFCTLEVNRGESKDPTECR